MRRETGVDHVAGGTRADRWHAGAVGYVSAAANVSTVKVVRVNGL